MNAMDKVGDECLDILRGVHSAGNRGPRSVDLATERQGEERKSASHSSKVRLWVGSSGEPSLFARRNSQWKARGVPSWIR